MLYLIYGTEEYLIDENIKNILKENNIEEINISKYDLDTDTLKSVIEDASTISLFASKKAIIVDNSNIFSTQKLTIDTKELEEYLNNYNPDTIIIFKLLSETIDGKKKIVKAIKEKGKLIDYNKDIDVQKIVEKLFDNYKIKPSSINLLIDRVGENIYLLKEEIDKIKLFKDNDLTITDEDIIKLTTKSLDTDIFKLINSVIDNNKGLALEIYENMLKMQEEPLKLIITLANKIRLMYQVKELFKNGYNQQEIAQELSISPSYVYMLNKNAARYNSNILLKYLDELADIDYNIKCGKIDKNLAFEFFILEK